DPDHAVGGLRLGLDGLEFRLHLLDLPTLLLIGLQEFVDMRLPFSAHRHPSVRRELGKPATAHDHRSAEIDHLYGGSRRFRNLFRIDRGVWGTPLTLWNTAGTARCAARPEPETRKGW